MYERIKQGIISRVERGRQGAERGLLTALRHAPFDSTRFGPPRGFTPSASEWVARHASHGGALHVLETDAAFSRTPPKTIDGSFPWQFEQFYEGVQGRAMPGTVLSVPRGRVFGTGTIIDDDDCMIGDVSREMIRGNDQSRHTVFSRMQLPPVKELSGTVGVTAVVGADVYWHWMVDLLPRLHLLRRHERDVGPVDRIVISPVKARFQSEMLDALGVDRSRLLETHRDAFHIRADRVLAPSITQQVPARWVCDFLHNELGPKLGASNAETSELLYVSRNDARNRRLLNEDQMMAKLSPLGFRMVTMTGRTVADQAAFFRNARVVITPHGSGLTNMVFSNPGTVVIELFQPAYVNTCYWAIADFLGIDYYALIGGGKPVPTPPAGVDHRQWFFQHMVPDAEYGDDIMIDIDHLLELLRRSGVH